MRDPVQRDVPSRPGGGGEAAGSGRQAEAPGATGTMSIGEVLGILKPEFPDITVSRRHAEIRRGANGFTVHDVGSLNGTYLNRERVEDGELGAGDELQIGEFKLVLFAGSRAGGGG